ncbi:hypothetical protein, partial [Burkholderia gladioli]|uniref:hypothetical protein n=1 Tax=Burkholderia gladioli TaxID=28095 RepID=UPI001ABA2BC0
MMARKPKGESSPHEKIVAEAKERFARCEEYESDDLPDFFGPFQSWRTASVASVEQYRCLNS